MYLAVDLLCDLFSKVLLALFQALALHHTHEAGALDFRAQRLSHIVNVGLYILVVLGLYELLVYQAVLLVALAQLTTVRKECPSRARSPQRERKPHPDKRGS